MFDFNIHFSWADYFAMILFCTLWNCGFKAITAKGKIMYFITEFFSQKVYTKTYLSVQECSEIISTLKKHFPANSLEPATLEDDAVYNRVSGIIADYIKINELHAGIDIQQIISNIVLNKPVEFYKFIGEDRFSDLVKDPIVICITCMASVHGTILYIAECIFHHHAYNIFEQIVISIPVAFTGEFLFKLKGKLEK